MRDTTAIRESLLTWYDQQARILPWRVPPDRSKRGERPDPYRVWLSEIMLQQTTVAAVKSYFRTFTDAWPDIHALAQAQDDDVMAAWAGLGYYARARNLLACARIVSGQLNGTFPQSAEELQKLPGIGPYTSAAISAIAFGQRAVVVDGNVERVMARLFAIADPLPASKPVLYALADPLTPTDRPGDFAQAVMDLGATICGRSPKCEQCPLARYCEGRAKGIAAQLPAKPAKTPKPVRQGVGWLAATPKGFMLERRPPNGLLGGLFGIPVTGLDGGKTDTPPFPADWHALDGTISHTFTHFRFEAEICVATLPAGFSYDGPLILVNTTLPEDAFPTLFRKIYRHGKAGLDLL